MVSELLCDDRSRLFVNAWHAAENLFRVQRPDHPFGDGTYWLASKFADGSYEIHLSFVRECEQKLNDGRFARFTPSPLQYSLELEMRPSDVVKRSAILNEMFDWLGEARGQWTLCLKHERHLYRHLSLKKVPVVFGFSEATTGVEFALRWAGLELP